MRRYRAKPNRWLRRHPPARGTRINDSCKPQYVLRSTWYRRPAWSFKSRLTPKQIDERYAQWKQVTVDTIRREQQLSIARQMRSLMRDFYSGGWSHG